MKSVADELRIEARAQQAARSVDDRLRDALRLGERDARLFAGVRGITVDEARRILSRQRQHGRMRSACHESLFE